MTKIFCDADCIYAKPSYDRYGNVSHTNCSAQFINLFFSKKEGHPCTMYEKKR